MKIGIIVFIQNIVLIYFVQFCGEHFLKVFARFSFSCEAINSIINKDSVLYDCASF